LPRGVKTFPGRLPFVAHTRPKPLPLPLLARWSWWILPILVTGAIALAVGLLRIGGPDLPFILLGTVLSLALVWIVVSTLNPARADRTCGECGEEALERLDPGTTRGVVCSSCGHTDRDASSWYLAEEEETTLEKIVLAERARSSESEPEEFAHASSADAAPNVEITE